MLRDRPRHDPAPDGGGRKLVHHRPGRGQPDRLREPVAISGTYQGGGTGPRSTPSAITRPLLWASAGRGSGRALNPWTPSVQSGSDHDAVDPPGRDRRPHDLRGNTTTGTFNFPGDTCTGTFVETLAPTSSDPTTTRERRTSPSRPPSSAPLTTSTGPGAGPEPADHDPQPAAPPQRADHHRGAGHRVFALAQACSKPILVRVASAARAGCWSPSSAVA